MAECTETLYDFWCVYNYSADNRHKCPMEGRSPHSLDAGTKVAQFDLVVEYDPGIPCSHTPHFSLVAFSNGDTCRALF